jgi:hypothetical protein
MLPQLCTIKLEKASQACLNRRMKHALSLAFCGLMLTASAADAAVCLSASQIQSSDSDGKSLTLTMKNGEVWQGQLLRPCSGLRFSGFSWELRGDKICENAQTLRVISTGSICALGKLSLRNTTPAKK